MKTQEHGPRDSAQDLDGDGSEALPPMEALRDRLERLSQENQELHFQSFSYRDAWTVGSHVVHLATEQSLPVAITIVFGEQRVFHAALPGSSADNDDWLDRKIRTVRRFGHSSMYLATKFESAQVRIEDMPHLNPADYAAAGGAIPIKVQGSIVAILGISGLSEQADHDLAARALRHHLENHVSDQRSGLITKVISQGTRQKLAGELRHVSDARLD